MNMRVFISRTTIAIVLLVIIFGCQPTPLEQYFSSISKTPIKFEKGNVSTSEIEYNSSFSPVGASFYFSMAAKDFSSRSIMVSEFSNDRFMTPKRVSIGGQFYDASDVQITKDGQTLYFKMRGNISTDSSRRDGNIWRSQLLNGSWGEPQLLPEEINSYQSEYYPIMTDSGNLYFSRDLESTSYDIFVSKFVDGKYQEAVSLGGSINTELLESDAYVSPDETFMIFVRMYSDEGLGVSDLYITFNDQGVWSRPKNMRSLNSKGVDGSPFVTPDGKYFFFTSTRDAENPENFDGHLDIYVVAFDKDDWR